VLAVTRREGEGIIFTVDGKDGEVEIAVYVTKTGDITVKVGIIADPDLVSIERKELWEKRIIEQEGVRDSRLDLPEPTEAMRRRKAARNQRGRR
jgi:sRNA-binding carbon storage regulator CsrA